MGRWLMLLIWMLVAGVGAPLWGQTLAHRNWAGSGMTVDPWWAGAELYEIDPIDFADANGDGFGDLRGVTGRLDYLEGLGVDALVISSVPLKMGGAGQQPFEEVNGTVEDFDRLVEDAARHKMRVLVDVRLSAADSTFETLAAARYWLSRGVAGLRVVSDEGAPVSATAAAERVRALRRLCASFAGQRVLISDLDGGLEGAGDAGARRAGAFAVSGRGKRRGIGAPGGPGGEAGAQMVEDGALVRARDLPALRSAVRTGAERVVATDADGQARSWTRLGDGVHDAAMAKVVAAVLLLGGGAPLVYFGQEVGMAGGGGPEPMQWGVGAQGFTAGVPWIEMGPNAETANVAGEEGDAGSLLGWYRTLGALRKGNGALRSGGVEVLASGNADLLLWVRRARLGEREAAPVVVAVNLSGRAVPVPAAGVGSLRVLASTFAVDGPLLSVPAYGVFVGEERKAAGLETVVLPARVRRR